ncbi:MAG: amino acid adenylation domain protein [Bacteroidetes bacterium]|nr:amino acid adenylation domain protein [Bacteroidota bacterium]
MEIEKKIANDYWSDKFASAEELIFYPSPEPAVNSFHFRIAEQDISSLLRLSKGNPNSEFALLLSLFSMLLQKYNDTNEIIICSPSIDPEKDTAQPSPDLFYRFVISPPCTMREYIKNCQLEIRESLKYRKYDPETPGTKIADGGKHRQFGFVYSKVNDAPAKSKNCLLNLEIIFENGCFNGKIDFDESVFSKVFAERMAAHFLKTLRSFEELLDHPLASFNFMTDEETKILLNEFSGVKIGSPTNHLSISILFSAQAKLHPDKAAVIYNGQPITYKDLETQSQRLALYLKSEMGIKPGDFVGVMMEYTAQSIISFLAIIKAGAIYVPLDHSLPAERLQYIIEDAQCRAIILNSDFIENVILFDIPLFNIDIQLDSLADQEYIAVPATAAAPMYLMYTSGSTGKPKGVLVRQESVIRLVKQTNYIDINAGDRLLGVSNFAFDGSTFDIWGALLNGGTLVLFPKEVFLDLDKLTQLLSDKVTDIMFLTTALFNVLVDKGPECFKSLKHVLFGGEAVSVKHVNAFFKTNGAGKLIHVYGPTENTTFSTFFPIDSAPAGHTVPIGRAIAYSHCYILGRHLQLQPIECFGELYVSGTGLSSGYLNDPQLTSERFIDHPFLENLKLYKTGDICKWLPDGTIAFIGRRDNQVKIRGYRIEADEIQNYLLSHPDIKESKVVVSGKADNKHLVAYFVSGRIVNPVQLKEYLSGRLPHYMLPSYFKQVGAMPLNRNGKIDIQSLLTEENILEAGAKNMVLPRTKTEEYLYSIWKDILGHNDISVNDIFFDIGGHSLKATQIISRVHRDLGIKIGLKEVFLYQTIEKLSEHIENVKTQDYTTIKPVPAAADYPLSSSQKRLLILSQFKNGNTAYNMAGTYLFEGSLNKTALSNSFNALIERHEILRTVFRENENSEVRQVIVPAGSSDINLSYYDNYSTSQEVNAVVESLIKSPFDLTTGPLLRLCLLKTETNKWIFVCAMHHIISDGWSMGIMIRELLALYAFHTKAAPGVFPPLRIQYKDYAAWQQGQLATEAFSVHKNYWLNKLSGALPVLELSTDLPRPAVKTFNGGIIHRVINPGLANGIRKLSQEQGCTMFMGLLAAVNILLYRYSNQEDFIIGTVVAGREYADLEDQIGFYVNTLALRTTLNREGTYSELLNNIRQVTLDAYEHQAYPFDELIESMKLTRNMSRSPLFDVMIVLQNGAGNLNASHQLGEVKVSPYEVTESVISKFDLTFNFVESSDTLLLSLEYNNDIYYKDTAERLSNHLEQLFAALLKSPETALNRLNFLSPEERHQVLVEFNNTETDYPGNRTIPDLFEEQVKKTPENTALICGETLLNYRELHEITNQMADYLQKNYNILTQDRIGIKLKKSHWTFISMLGILKAGCAYVPIDFEYPQERTDYIIRDSNCKILIDEKELKKFLEQKKFTQKNIFHDS